MLDHIAAPETDQQEHRGQLNFPEQEEEQQVKRHKDAHYTRFQQQEQRHIVLHALLFPTTYYREHGQQRVQDHHRQAQAIDAQEVIDFEARRANGKVNPGNIDSIGQMAEITKALPGVENVKENVE